jgi:hypothetical protein
MGSRPKFQPWCLKIRCNKDLPRLANLTPKKRKEYFETNRNVLKHQSQVCLLIDGELVAFPSINRDINKLAENPPLLLLQFAGISEAGTTRTMMKLKTAARIQIVQIDTAIYSFEPVLKRLQETKDMQLKDELLFWSDHQPIQEPPEPPTRLTERIIEADPAQDLCHLLGTTKSVKLDHSQRNSLLACLTQRVSLIQGPPGKTLLRPAYNVFF